MKVKFFDPGQEYRNHKVELDAVWHNVMNRGDLILQGDVRDFEALIASYFGEKYAVGVNSGTDALFLTLKAMGIGKGDEVITSAHTFKATIEAIHHTGATPILVDIGDDYLMDMNQVAEKITLDTKVIIPVHLSGDVCDWTTLLDFQKMNDYRFEIVEDSCQAFGAAIGVHGIASCYSFYPAKMLGCAGDGGAVVTKNKELADKVRGLRNHVGWGYNSRLDNLQAAILLEKFRYHADTIARRKEIAVMYDERLAGTPLVLPKERHMYQDYVVRSDEATEMAGYLGNAGIQTLGVNLEPNHIDLGIDVRLPKYEEYSKQFVRLPCNQVLSDEQVVYVCDKINEYYGL